MRILKFHGAKKDLGKLFRLRLFFPLNLPDWEWGFPGGSDGSCNAGESFLFLYENKHLNIDSSRHNCYWWGQHCFHLQVSSCNRIRKPPGALALIIQSFFNVVISPTLGSPGCCRVLVKTQSASSHPGVFDLVDLQWEHLFLNASLENLKLNIRPCVYMCVHMHTCECGRTLPVSRKCGLTFQLSSLQPRLLQFPKTGEDLGITEMTAHLIIPPISGGGCVAFNPNQKLYTPPKLSSDYLRIQDTSGGQVF